jgi:hypothetical protein
MAIGTWRCFVSDGRCRNSRHCLIGRTQRLRTDDGCYQGIRHFSDGLLVLLPHAPFGSDTKTVGDGDTNLRSATHGLKRDANQYREVRW